MNSTVSTPPLPPDHVLNSGTVIFPGAFDRHGCPLVIFPVETQSKVESELTKEELTHFILYFQRMHSKNKGDGLVSVVADLKDASLTVTRVVAESLLLLEGCRRTIHTLYVVQPRKRDGQKMLQKLLQSTPAKRSPPAQFKCVFLKEVCELSLYVDRSQLTGALGGYLVYRHTSWVSFIKEVDSFVQEFVAVVRRLPSCIAALQNFSHLPLPEDVDDLGHFCSAHQSRLQQLRRELGLDELLRRCEHMLEKLRYPESDPCYQDMVGTVLFTHTTLEMLHNYDRITAAVDKVEMLWQQVFSKPRLQLQVLRLKKEAQQVGGEMQAVLQVLQVKVSVDSAGAEVALQEFEASEYTHAMVLLHRVEELLHLFLESVPGAAVQGSETWLEELVRESTVLRSALEIKHRSLRTACRFIHCFHQVERWYAAVLCEGFLQQLQWEVCWGGQEGRGSAEGLPWRRALRDFLVVQPCPQVEQLVQLAQLAHLVPEPRLQEQGKRLAHRCMTLRKVLTSPHSATLRELQLALEWQGEHSRSTTASADLTSQKDGRVADGSSPQSRPHAPPGLVTDAHSPGPVPTRGSGTKEPPLICCSTVPDSASASGKPASLSSFDSGFEGQPESGRDGVLGARTPRLQTAEDPQGPGDGSRYTSAASIRIVPRIAADSLDLEIKVKRSASLPKNPWLGLPVDDLDSSYMVTISPGSCRSATRSPSPGHGCRDAPTQTEGYRETTLSPIRNILSSTITESGDRGDVTAEAAATLLWDTYDLRDLRQESCDGLLRSVCDVSLGDWELRERDELRAVEEILARTAGILQEEESVLAQEGVLDVLLQQEEHPDTLWPSWNPDVQLSQTSPVSLAEAGVIGLDDDLDTPLNSSISSRRSRHDDVGSSTGSPIITPESPPPAHHLKTFTRAPERTGVLQELKNLQDLEEKIMEENLKIQALRLSQVQESHVAETVENSYHSHEERRRRRRFLKELEREKRELEELERSLDGEVTVKKMRSRPVRACKVIKCSVMGRGSSLLTGLEENDDDDDEVHNKALLTSCRREPHDLDLERYGSVTGHCSGTMEPTNLEPHSVKDEAADRHLDRNALTTAVTEHNHKDFAPTALEKREPPHTDEMCNTHTTAVIEATHCQNYNSDTSANQERSGLDHVALMTSVTNHNHPDVAPPALENGESPTDQTCNMPTTVSGEAAQCQPFNFTSTNREPSDLDDGALSTSVTNLDGSGFAPPVLDSGKPPSDKMYNEYVSTAGQVTRCQSSNSQTSASHNQPDLDKSLTPVSINHKRQEFAPLSLENGDCPSPDKTRNAHNTATAEPAHCQPDTSSNCDASYNGALTTTIVVRGHQDFAPPVLKKGESPLINEICNAHITAPKEAAHGKLFNSDTSATQDRSGLDHEALTSAVIYHNHQDFAPPVLENEESPASLGTCSAHFTAVAAKCSEIRPERVQAEGLSTNKDNCSNLDAAVTSGCSDDDMAVRLSVQQRAAFDPGGDGATLPVPVPRLKRRLRHEGTRSLSEMEIQAFIEDPVLDEAPTRPVVPKPKERKVPPRGKHEDSNNNNNKQQLCVESTGDGQDSGVEYTGGDRAEADNGPTSEPESPLSEDESDVGYDVGASTRSACRSPVHQQGLQICTREMSEFQTPLVLDTGSGLVKAGFADQDLPTTIFPTAIGLPKYEEVMSGSVDRSVYVGHDAQHMRGVLTLQYPIKNGTVTNWDQMEMIWHHTFQQLCVDPEDHPVLLTEGPMNSRENRQRAVQIMFESFNVPLAYMALQPVLALYAAGRTTGVVFDSGDGVSHSVPVFEGYCLPHAVQRCALSGSDVTLQLRKLLLEQGVCMRTSAELEIVREIKERCCCVALDYEAKLRGGGGAGAHAQYTLPDGQVITLTTERFRAPEILFKPELIGQDHYGIHESIYKSILLSDIDLRRSFLGNIVLSGGNTLLEGLSERLQVEVGRLVPAGAGSGGGGSSVGVRVSGPAEREVSVWRGGAVLANLSSFASAWITRDEYEEFGPHIVFRKCF